MKRCVLLIGCFYFFSAAACPAASLPAAQAYSRSIKAAAAQDYPAAMKAAKTTADPKLLKLIEWFRLTDSKQIPDFSDAQNFIKKNPGWPRIYLIRRNAELALLETGKKSDLEKWFKQHPPVSTQAVLAYADILMEKKEWEKAIEAFNEAAGLQDRTEHQTYRWIAKTNLALINLELKNKSEAIMHAREIILGYYSSKQDKFKYIFAADNKTAYTDFFTDKEMVSILLMLRILYKNDQTEYTKIIEKVTQTDIGVLPKEFEYFISHSLVSELKKTYYYVDGNFMIKC